MFHRERVNSIKDSRVVEARELASASGRRKLGKLLLYGLEQLEWARTANLIVEHVFVLESVTDLPPWLESVPLLLVSDGVSKKITDTNYTTAVVGVAREPSLENRQAGRLVLVLDDVRDAGNVGTLVRTARAFGIREVWGTVRGFDPFHRKTIDSSRGLVFSTRISQRQSPSDTVAALKASGYEVVVTSPHAATLQSRLRLSGRPIALVAGNETSGVCPELMAAADHVVQIPMLAVESLNVAVATGISIYELGFKLVLAMISENIRGTFGREFGSTHELMHRLLDKRLRESSGIGADDVIFLMRLACDRRSSLIDVAQDVRREGPALSEFLDSLSQQGWIAQEPDCVRITASGETLLAQLWPIVEAAHESALAGLGDDDLERLRAMMRRIQDNCGKELAV